MDRDKFMELVYDLLSEDDSNFRANMIIDAADEYAESMAKGAISVDWIEAEIKKLRDMDNEFAAMTAGQIEAMLKKWREEQEGEQHGQTD